MTRRRGEIKLPPPYLRRLWVDPDRIGDRTAYPFCLPFLGDDFELVFERAITIIVGENGVGKSTLIEAPSRRSPATTRRAAARATVRSTMRTLSRRWAGASRLRSRPRGDAAAVPPDFLSLSHGEGFMRFFEERCMRHGFFLFDEPESALSPRRQIEFLKLLRRIEANANAQVLIATHSPMLMAFRGARLLGITQRGLSEIGIEETDHLRVWREFAADPRAFVEDALRSDADPS